MAIENEKPKEVMEEIEEEEIIMTIGDCIKNKINPMNILDLSKIAGQDIPLKLDLRTMIKMTNAYNVKKGLGKIRNSDPAGILMENFGPVINAFLVMRKTSLGP